MEEIKQQTKQLIRIEDISKQVLDKLNVYQVEGSIKLPANYNAGNALKTAWLILQETKDKAGRPVLEVCSRESIARTLMEMVMKGLSAAKKQCYFIPYGTQLALQPSYFGNLALAKNVTQGKFADPVANIIYEGDEFSYEINPATGKKRIIQHKQSMENINPESIKGAYCIYTIDGVSDVEIMTIAQIKRSWLQGQGKGNTGAHTGFTDQMCKKTVISRACKLVVNSSDDAWLDDADPDAQQDDTKSLASTQTKKDIVNQPKEVVNIEEVEYEDIDSAEEAPPQEPMQEQPKNKPPF